LLRFSSAAPRRNLKPLGGPRTPSRPRLSIVTGLTNLLRRAAGRKPPDATIEPSTPRRDIPKRGLLPKKYSFLRTNRNKRTVTDSVVSSPRTSNASSTPRLQSPLRSPNRAAFHSNLDIPASAKDIFDDENLVTAKEISAAIASTQAEAARLLYVFTQVESTTSQRIHLQTVRHLPSATSPRSPDRKYHRRVPGALDLSDGASVDSKSSTRTSLSQSKSVSSLRSKLHPSSPLSPRYLPPIHSAHSASSLASQVPSPGQPAFSSTITANTSRSKLTDSEEMQSLDPVGHELVVEEASTPTGVFEVQQRRKEVMARYEARLEYLRARLKGAELHEKLLRK
jgi:hypothetical protein